MSHYLNYIQKRIKQNKNFICCITGGTGSGKSYSAVKLGEALDPNFDVRNICFTPEELMDLVNGKTKKLKAGSVIVFDEIQVSMGHLDFQNIVSKCLNYLFQTFRHRNFILIMTSPHFDFINASLRKLFHGRLETLYVNTKLCICCLKPLLIQVNQRSGKVYNKYLKVNGLKLKTMKVSLADKYLLSDYETKKTMFTTTLNEEISSEIKKYKEKRDKKPSASMDKVLRYWKDGLSEIDIAKKLKITVSGVQYYKKKLKTLDIVVGKGQKGVEFGSIA